MWNPFKPRVKRATIEEILDDSEDMATKQSRVLALVDKLSADVMGHNVDAHRSIRFSDEARVERARVCRIAGATFDTFRQ
jgi:hypothetical protein